MRQFRNVLALSALALAGCHFVTSPDPDAVKAIRVLENPDPRTLVDYGHVYVENRVDPGNLRDAEILTVEKLKEHALRKYGETTLLYNVHVRSADTDHTFVGYAMAARRLGS